MSYSHKLSRIIPIVFAAILLVVLGSGLVRGHWPTGKRHATGPYVQIHAPCTRITWVHGQADTAVTTAGMYIEGLRASDQLLDAWYFDTTKFAINFTNHTSSIYYWTNDTLRDTLSTAAGYIMLIWNDAQPQNPDLEVTR